MDIVNQGVDGQNREINIIKRQKSLKDMFAHVDDSLLALSLRQAEIGEFVNDQVAEVQYNTDKALEELSESNYYQAGAKQQYVVSSSNALADYLVNTLNNMQQSMMSGQGQGQGDGFQLSDIIKEQEDLNESMGKGKQGQNSGKGKQGQNGKDNGGGTKGQGNKDGKQGLAKGKGEGSNGKGKEGTKEGSNGESGNGDGSEGLGNNQGGMNGQGISEEELFSIYKEQMSIKNKLEQGLKDMINDADKRKLQKLSKEMDNLGKELLEQGVTNYTKSKANSIKQNLWKLKNATLTQGQDKKRQSKTNKREYRGVSVQESSTLDKELNSIELLKKEVIPLQNSFKRSQNFILDATIEFGNFERFNVDINKGSYKSWIEGCIKNHNKKLGPLSIVLLTDEELYEYNRTYLNHDTYTDIITFDYTDGNIISGDLLISYERVVENSKENRAELISELNRVIIHGVLHLLGFTDKSPEDKYRMTQEEDNYLNKFHVEQ